MKSNKEIQSSAKKFKETWSDPSRGGEKQDSQQFWSSLLGDVFGVDDVPNFIRYEEKVKLDNASFIDGHIPSTRVLIEQKSRGKDLNKPIRQSDDSLLTPYQQAKRYSSELPLSEHPKWIVLSNFDEWHIYDMEKPQGDPEIIRLEDFDKDYYRLNFLVDDHQNELLQREMEISVQAGEIVGKLYDALLKEYRNPTDKETLKSLNELIVRLVFCLYAEDSGVFPAHMQFHDYMKDRRNPRGALIDLFNVLDTPEDERDPYLDEELLAFPYVNGGLFKNHGTEIPRLNDEIMEIIIREASEDFDWSGLSPTVFGACFESSLNPETRRSGGMHYTSIENIHKLIDPLFLNDLYKEFDELKDITNKSVRTKKLKTFQEKLAGLKFLDPACGSGNFLTETYLSLRKLENEILKLLLGDQIRIGLGEEYDPIRVSLSQFYGIEINDFAVSVAKTALWIAEHQMMRKTEEILHSDLDFLPLKTYTNIHEGNALRMDWNDVVPSYEVNYVYGNPPFIGYSLQGKSQKEEILSVYVDVNGKSYRKAGKIDYVSGWYFKAAELMQNTPIRTAFVSTNSITQGEQVAGVWKPLYERFGIHIDFAHRTFQWESEASSKAHVHCVIIGFSSVNSKKKRQLYSSERLQLVDNINPYLVNASNVFIESRKQPISDVPILQNGGKPTEGGFLILTEDEKLALLKEEPQAEVFIRPYMMGRDFIMRKPRYCIWLVHADPSILNRCPLIKKRIEQVREYRLSSTKAATKKKAETPMLFDEVRECTSPYVAIPKVSSENRRYIPMEYLPPEIIPGDKLFMMQNASLYSFGILTSNVHMAWVRAVCGRLKSDYSYSNTIVYNNFPWPTPTKAQKSEIEKTAQAILDARALYPDASLADLYDDLTMPSELRRAHQMNDKAVMNAYDFSYKGEDRMSEADCVSALMRMYQDLVTQVEQNKSKR